MRTHHKSTPLAYTLLVILTLWLISPAMAVNGDPELAKQAWPMIENGALLIDVRTKEEFDAGHIEGAINIPYQETNALMNAIGTDKQRPVVVYCRSGKRAGRAKAALDENGYTNIFNATGYEALKVTRP
ncbi:MAG: rhodanese-like domain-containing protein [Gammaproteobacteria bacterium]|nr:MAG: rhodanese-like domain-containing protein [Gammaproteobacteria bacterium]